MSNLKIHFFEETIICEIQKFCIYFLRLIWIKLKISDPQGSCLMWINPFSINWSTFVGCRIPITYWLKKVWRFYQTSLPLVFDRIVIIDKKFSSNSLTGNNKDFIERLHDVNENIQGFRLISLYLISDCYYKMNPIT